jgi:hypothetical protein
MAVTLSRSRPRAGLPSRPPGLRVFRSPSSERWASRCMACGRRCAAERTCPTPPDTRCCRCRTPSSCPATASASASERRPSLRAYASHVLPPALDQPGLPSLVSPMSDTLQTRGIPAYVCASPAQLLGLVLHISGPAGLRAAGSRRAAAAQPVCSRGRARLRKLARTGRLARQPRVGLCPW